jgi:glycosyltransferase involved in cell wall biosynthesis
MANKTLTIVIPALNEEEGIGPVIRDVPLKKLRRMGYKTEILVIDNNSTDNTGKIAKDHGANVIVMPIRGYGNAYKAGFANASGDIIATGDADLTYPFDILPEILLRMERENLDFINTDRLANLNKEVMTTSHQFGNSLLTFMTKTLFACPFNDSQSGMWIFKRSIWKKLNVTSSGMPFSQELKIEAFIHGFRCAEIPIDYRARAGKEKNNTIRDGMGNIIHLSKKRFSILSRDIARNLKAISYVKIYGKSD